MIYEMNKAEFRSLNSKYSPLIKDMIDKNVPFYRFNKKIIWQFDYDEDYSIIATCSKKTNIISINLKAVVKADDDNNLKEIEYFLLHEIRHIFQHDMIEDFNKGIKTPIPSETIEKWINEEKNYIKALDENGNENPGYFAQDIEMDAYAFSYAVMKYKYGEAKIYIPPMYGEDFFEIVNEWLKTFEEEKIPC